MININLNLGLDRFTPSEKVSGRIVWQLERAPELLNVNLIWHTAGRGSEDAAMVDQQVINQRQRQGEAEFILSLPKDGPYSYSGSLISIVWKIEVVAEPQLELLEREIIVSQKFR